MSPEEAQALQNRVAQLEGLLMSLVRSDRYTFEKKLQILEGRNIQLGTANGTQIGTESTQKLAFLGATPVAQQSALADLSPVGSDSDGLARTRCNEITALLQTYGFIA